MTTPYLVTIEPRTATVGDLAYSAAALTVLGDLVDDYRQAIRRRLGDTLDAERERLGAAPSVKTNGIAATLTDPQPKASVSDRERFGSWVVETDAAPYATRRVVELRDEEAAADALALLRDALATDADVEAAALDVFRFAMPGEAVVVEESALDDLVASGRAAVVDDATLVDTETGEAIPGTRVSRGARRVQVRPSSARRAALRRELVSALRLPPLPEVAE